MDKKEHKKIIKFIKAIRESFHESYIVYCFGGCYGFYTILKSIYPEAKAYFLDSEREHIITKIGDNYYDITGKVYGDGHIKLKKDDHDWWEVNAFKFTFERMKANYDDITRKTYGQI